MVHALKAWNVSGRDGHKFSCSWTYRLGGLVSTALFSRVRVPFVKDWSYIGTGVVVSALEIP